MTFFWTSGTKGLKRLKKKRLKVEIISKTSHSTEASLDPDDKEMRNCGRLYPRQLIIAASNLFRKDCISIYQVIHKFWIQHLLFLTCQIFTKIKFHYMPQLICTTAMFKCVNTHVLWVQLQPRKTMNLTQTVV